MAISALEGHSRGLELSVGELMGALGDSVTVLPVVVALGALTAASLPHLLLGFAVFQAVWGLWYGLPVSVEPMKALAGLAIAGTLAYGELVAAGLLAGGLLLVAGRTGTMARIQRYVAEPVIRGVQLSVAAVLALAGFDLAAGAPTVAVVGLVVAVAATLVYRRAGALAVLAVGTAVALWSGGVPAVSVPALAVFPAGGPTLTTGAVEGLAGQLAMTVGNAAVATSLLLSDLFDAEVSADDLATSMGSMNLLAVPLGAVPMCHGSGGLAGKYAFGARTGGANLVLAGLYLVAALVAGLWAGFPLAMLGVLLLAVAWQLATVALDSRDRPLVVGMALLAVATNVGVAFVAGVVGHAALRRVR
ncbi:putative sulfate/molybdate transporter [Halorarius litoreus]|uniref:putative sulfate/molybdate transporter n=1 Tax=Halorarius litoreus TaxID=2962676 RepID=UPI0020CF3F16|nr:putative sulfate/molybdate transporter [Halorarius litoreus]